LARANLSGIANDSVGGNSDGVVRDTPQARESLLAWVHLSHANLISGNYRASGSQPDAAGEWPRNPYGATLQLQYDAQYSGSGGVSRLSLKTGNQVPARILAEIDRKIDDGRANSGQFRFSAYDGGGGPPSAKAAVTTRTGLWRAAENEANCGASGAVLIVRRTQPAQGMISTAASASGSPRRSTISPDRQDGSLGVWSNCPPPGRRTCHHGHVHAPPAPDRLTASGRSRPVRAGSQHDEIRRSPPVSSSLSSVRPRK
jgi:hypothetical protein